MNTTVDTQKIEKLNQLKAEQERIELEIRAQEREAKNEIKKAEAISRAESLLKKNVEKELNLEQVKDRIASEAAKLNIELGFKTKTLKITETPWTYIFNPVDSKDEQWKGAPISQDIQSTVISYKDVILTVQSDGTIELPYYIANSNRTFKLKTAIKKIDEYVAKENQKVTDKQRKEKALNEAVEYLTRSIKQAGAKAEITTRSTGSTGYDYTRSRREQIWVEWNEITVQFENGNRLRYKVGYTANETFTLNLTEFFDSRITDIKKDPILSINHLK